MAADRRWAVYGNPVDGLAPLLGVVTAGNEKAAIRAAMAEFGLPWRGVKAVRVLGDDATPASTLDFSRPGDVRPWDGSDLEYHELCTLFPPMADETFAELVACVRRDGPRRVVVLHEGKILDGRHAYRAYREVGVGFSVREWAGECGNPLDFVLAENLVRRDLTASQRAALAVEVKRLRGEELRGNSLANLKRGDEAPESRVVKSDNSGRDARAEAAKELNVSAGYVHAAEKVAEASPETFEAVKRGEISITAAKEKLGLSKPKPKPKPEPEPADSGMVTVNGERKADASVERQRAAGVIPAGVEVVVEDPGDEAGDSIEAAREERAEAAAKIEDLTDDEWIATLPLASLLSGVSLSRFTADALYYRRFEPVRRSLMAFHGKARSLFRGSFRGVSGYAVERLLKIEHPSRWRKCPPTEKDGCGGLGTVPIVGECGLCKGRGYLSK